jgi:hypothetical protein
LLAHLYNFHDLLHPVDPQILPSELQASISVETGSLPSSPVGMPETGYIFLALNWNLLSH